MTTHPFGTRDCAVARHCHTHHRDEPHGWAAAVCYECGHVYRTALSVWWANVRTGWWSARMESLSAQVAANPAGVGHGDGMVPVPPLVPRWWATRFFLTAVFTRPSRVQVCPLCHSEL